MFPKSVFLAVITALVLGATARADEITTSVLAQLQAPGFPGPLANIDQLGATQGQIFTNQIDGVPFTPGSDVQTVGAFIIPTVHVHNDGTISGIQSLNNPGNVVVIVFGVKGTLQPGTLLPTSLFTQGMYKAFEIPTGQFNPFHPGTWLPATGFFTPAYFGATGSLKSPDNLGPGPNGFPISPTPSDQVNKSAADPDITVATVGSLLYNNGGNALTPADSLFLQIIAQQIEATTNFGFNAADIAALNAIANAAFGTNFATGFGPDGPESNPFFNPGFIGNINTTGDFGATLLLTITPAQQVAPPPPPPPPGAIPEIDPGSMLNALTVLGAGMLILSDKWRQRRK
jgi:hypothetical protein